MPRGRKRVAPKATEEIASLKEPKIEVDADDEEVFVDILDDDETPSAPEPLNNNEIPLGEPTSNSSKDDSDGSYPYNTRGKRKVVPRLVHYIDEEYKPKRTTSRGARTRAAAATDNAFEGLKNPKTECDDEEGELTDVGEHKCEFCELILYTNEELLEHKRGFHTDKVREEDLPSGTLLCAHPHCDASFQDVRLLIAHLVAAHGQKQYRIRKLTFSTMDKYLDWLSAAEKQAKAKFIGQDPEPNDDGFLMSMHCEYCDDWYNQEKNGTPIPEQIPRKMIGCPAFFTANIDNKKKKASVIGCFSHLGHHKRASWTKITEGKVVSSSATSIKCDHCDMVFRNRGAVTRHHRMVHQSIVDAEGNKKTVLTEPKQPSLECSDPECDMLFDSMVLLVEHVARVHKGDVQVDEFQFLSIEKFEEWKTKMEQDTCSKFCKVSGRVLPNEVTKYFLCHLSGHTNRTKKKEFTPQEKQRNRPTKKMGRYCTAFMSFKQSKIDGTVQVRGCFRHFGHPLEVRRLPLPDKVRQDIADLLLKGHLEDEVTHQIRSQYNENERGYYLQRYEVRNIALKLQREGLILANKPFMTAEEDGRLWDEMGFPAEGSYISEYMPIRSGAKIVPLRQRHPRRIDIHPDRPTHSRYLTEPKMEPMEMVEYVDDYSEDEELVAMEDGVYYEQDIEEEEVIQEDGNPPMMPQQTYVEEPIDLPQASQQRGRKRMPLLKEPMKTGNPQFDNVMAKMKSRFNTISQQLKETQDVRLAHGMLKELKDLQHRMGVGQNEVMMGANWNEEYFDEIDEDEVYHVGKEEVYHVDGQEVEHEEQVVANDGYEYIVEEGSVNVVEGEEVIS